MPSEFTFFSLKHRFCLFKQLRSTRSSLNRRPAAFGRGRHVNDKVVHVDFCPRSRSERDLAEVHFDKRRQLGGRLLQPACLRDWRRFWAGEAL